MNFDDYQHDANRTAAGTTGPLRLAIFGLGLAGEAGEVVDYLKKGLGHGHAIDPEVIKKELGDVLWYLAAIAGEFNLSLNEIAAANVAKLRARYPNGFTPEASRARVDQQSCPCGEALPHSVACKFTTDPESL